MAVVTGKRGLSPIFLDQSVADTQPAIKARRRAAKRIVFGWYGGKFSHLDWLLPLLPAAHHYCEPFAGSAAVLLNRDPVAGGNLQRHRRRGGEFLPGAAR